MAQVNRLRRRVPPLTAPLGRQLPAEPLAAWPALGPAASSAVVDLVGLLRLANAPLAIPAEQVPLRFTPATGGKGAPGGYAWLRHRSFASGAEPPPPKGQAAPFVAFRTVDLDRYTWFKNRDLAWDELEEWDKEQWRILGWSQETWDNPTDRSSLPATQTAHWEQLSDAERSAATKLGYTPELWEEDEGEVFRESRHAASWHELDPSHRQAWGALGWNWLAWDKGDDVSTEHKSWLELNTEERRAAARLGYSSTSWDEPEPALGPTKPWYRRDLFKIACMSIAALLFVLYDYTGNYKRRQVADQEDQVNCVHVRRHHASKREDWQARCDAIGFHFHSANGIRWSPDWMGSYGAQDPYWCEDGVYILSEEAKVKLQAASFDLHNMCLQAVDRVVHDEHLLDLFEIPHSLRAAVKTSWEQRQPDLIGRFDIIYDGTDEPKMLEYNADTPTLLIESSLAQEQWKKDRKWTESYSQFNQIHELLVHVWPKFMQRSASATGVGSIPPVVFAAQRAALEERCNVDYLATTAQLAGLQGTLAELSDLHVDPLGNVIHRTGPRDPWGDTPDAPGAAVQALWKLYPYEWLADEELGSALEWDVHVAKSPMIWAEPPWKLVLANKAILALLWEMFPGHPNLLPAFFTIEEVIDYQSAHKPSEEEWGWVSKPRFGREGLGVRYSFTSPSLGEFDRKVRAELAALESTEAPYNPVALQHADSVGREAMCGAQGGIHRILEDRQEAAERQHATLRADVPFPPVGGPVFQLYEDTETFHGRRPVIGSWVVFGSAAGICVREDIQRTTDNDSCMVPHLVGTGVQHKIHVKQDKVKGAVDMTGTYVPCGFMRGFPIYRCFEKGLYLLKNSDEEWMITAQEGGGADGDMGLAVAEHGLTAKHSLPLNCRWRLAGGSSCTLHLHQTAVVVAPFEATLAPAAAKLRKELYGEEGGRVNEHHDRHHGGGHVGRGYYTTGYGRGSTHSPGPGSTQSHAHQKAPPGKHARTSAQKAWKSYGTRQATGTYGHNMSRMGSGGS